MQKSTNKKVNLNKIELICVTIYLLFGMLSFKYAGDGIAVGIMSLMMTVFSILLILFFRQHTYGQDKPWLTVISLYYKSTTYLAIILAMANFPFRTYMIGAAMFSTIIYAVLAFFFGKKYDEMLNAYLYLCLVGFVSGVYL